MGEDTMWEEMEGGQREGSDLIIFQFKTMQDNFKVRSE